MSNRLFGVSLLLVIAVAAGGDRYFSAVAKRQTVSERAYPKPSYVRYETKINDQQLMFLARQQARQTETQRRLSGQHRARQKRPDNPEADTGHAGGKGLHQGSKRAGR